jgi:twinkle protein
MQGTPALAYLTDTRGLHVETLKAYRIRSHKRPSDSNTDFIGFQFVCPDGDPVMLKSTGIKPRSDGKKDTWTTAPYYTLWGWWLVKPTDRAIIITEGEYDAMSVHQLNPGMPVLSLPAGASNLTWIENDYDALIRFERIYICTDADDAGEKCAQEMAKRLGLARCSRIKPPSPFKDANQFLTECEDETAGIESWFAAATSYDPPTLRATSAYRDDVKARIKREKAEDNLNTFVFPSLPFQLRPGECTLLTGYTGHGKSEFLYQALTHEMGNGERTCIASMEIDAAEMITNIGTQLLGHKPADDAEVDRVIDWLDGRLWFVTPKDSDDDKPTSSAELFADFAYAVARFGVTRLAIDSLMFLVGKDDYDAQDALAKACRNFCRKKHPNTHVILIAHSAIKQGEDKMPSASSVQGSTGILAPFNNILTVWRNVDKEEQLEKAEGNEAKTAEILKQHDGVLKVWKQRRTGKRPRANLWFDPAGKRFRMKRDDAPPPTIETARNNDLPITEDEPF